MDELVTLANKKHFFQNALEAHTYSGADLGPKHDVAFRFSLN